MVLVYFLHVSVSLNMHGDHPLNLKGKVLVILGERRRHKTVLKEGKQ